MKKWIIIALFIIASISVYKYVYKQHRDIANETSSFKLTSIDLSNEFAINPSDSENKYLNKTIEVRGITTEIGFNNLTLDDKVFCQFSNKMQETFTNNHKVNIKGRCIGYDDLLEQVKLDQCHIIN
jgi:tRNA_anti-like